MIYLVTSFVGQIFKTISCFIVENLDLDLKVLKEENLLTKPTKELL